MGHARLFTNAQQVWLIAQELDPSVQTSVAVNPTTKPTPLRLETPAGVISAFSWGMGRIEWTVSADGEQTVRIDGLHAPENLSVPAGVNLVWQQ